MTKKNRVIGRSGDLVIRENRKTAKLPNHQITKSPNRQMAIVLSGRRASTEAWRKLRATISLLTDPDLEQAREIEMLSGRRPEVLQALRAERRKRQGKKLSDEPTEVEAIL